MSLKPVLFYFSNNRLVSQCTIFLVTRLLECVEVHVGLSLIFFLSLLTQFSDTICGVSHTSLFFSRGGHMYIFSFIKYCGKVITNTECWTSKKYCSHTNLSFFLFSCLSYSRNWFSAKCQKQNCVPYLRFILCWLWNSCLDGMSSIGTLLAIERGFVNQHSAQSGSASRSKTMT